MKKFALLLAVLAVPTIALISCSKNSPTAPSLAPDQGKMMFALDAADNIATGQVTVTKGALTHVLPITITDHSGTVTFAGIQVGHWDILVQLYDEGGAEIYTGTGEAIVTKDETTTVTIRVEHNTGTLIINVEVPGLILWNKLGSDAEVQNSEVGPDGIINGNVIFDEVQFNNGVMNETYSNISFDNCFFNGEKGCVEFWFKTSFDFINGVIPGGRTPSWFYQNGYEYNGNGAFKMITYIEGDLGTKIRIIVGTGENYTAVLSLNNVSWSANEPHHFALTYDNNASFDGNKTLALYIDGQQVDSSSINWDTYDKGTAPFILGNALNTLIDNLKIWNYPKTNFSDRFVE